ncbi:hypothetical protein HOV56_gp05 [Nitrosopumilus spindle-shaped virus]|uniref:Uncharacterized protein n=1 Tax=Nitrosopumilus spindle-shaped virus TaxID=2508184 RepID=A0A514K2Q0_9VIRU|nr:hypothetical protein HOV56_gp05 [Nitrosopumilus spindle-shaped virus]YP_010772835.1 hypothetical protein QIT54_gp05 [Nitrosopumilus spindle-shaped virus]QDI73894.1 hypothetical protein [Nitrosopumilus spindle-shaped virus]QDI73943.1 hypothetical protein [Nitrosopumilus spindle-shaped virus]
MNRENYLKLFIIVFGNVAILNVYNTLFVSFYYMIPCIGSIVMTIWLIQSWNRYRLYKQTLEVEK